MSKIDQKMDRLEGKMKETIGKVTNQEDLELKGKLKVLKSDISSKGEEFINKASEKANDLIDRMKEDRHK